MAKLSANKTLSGSWAQVWVDGVKIAELSKLTLTVTMKRTKVQMGMDIDSKIEGYSGAGKMKVRLVFTRFYDVLLQAQQGKDKRCTITTALTDPDAMNGGEERWSISNVAFDTLPFVDYETGEVNQQEFSFSFTPGDMKNLDGISVVELA